MRKIWKYNRIIKNVATKFVFCDSTTDDRKKLAETKKILVELQQKRESYPDILMVVVVLVQKPVYTMYRVVIGFRPEAFHV